MSKPSRLTPSETRRVCLRKSQLTTLLLFFCTCSAPLLALQQPCEDRQIVTPKLPTMVEADLALLRETDSQAALPEWSKIEKLRSFYKRYADQNAPCVIIQGAGIEVRLFVAHDSIEEEAFLTTSGLFESEKFFQFFGVSRLKVERSDRNVARRYALPIQGAARVADVVAIIERSEMETFEEDLAQLQMITVPRIHPHPNVAADQTDCFQVSSVTVIPSRVFDEAQSLDRSGGAVSLSLEGRRRALEHVWREVNWLERIETEEAACGTEDQPGFRGRQITSLNLTVKELVPDLDFVAESIRFWNELEGRINGLREAEEDWMKELGVRRPPEAKR